MSIRDVRKQQRAKLDDTYEGFRPISWGVIQSVGGSTAPPNRPGYVWIDEYGLEANRTVVRNPTTLNVAGAVVWIVPDEKPPHRKVGGIYTGLLAPNSTTPTSQFAVPEHAANHQMPSEDNLGADPVKIYQPALQPLKSTGDGSSLTITTQPLVYVVGGIRRLFSGGTTDLTSYVPSTASKAVRVLISLNESSNLLVVTAGTEVADSGAIPVPYPAVPERNRPSAYVKLVTGQTAVTTATHIDDARDFLAGTSGTLPAPTAQGQILIAHTTSQLELGVPLVDQYGDIMTDEAGEIMTL